MFVVCLDYTVLYSITVQWYTATHTAHLPFSVVATITCVGTWYGAL